MSKEDSYMSGQEGNFEILSDLIVKLKVLTDLHCVLLALYKTLYFKTKFTWSIL